MSLPLPHILLRRRQPQTARDNATSHKQDMVTTLITDPPPTSFTSFSLKRKKRKKEKIRHITCDM